MVSCCFKRQWRGGESLTLQKMLHDSTGQGGYTLLGCVDQLTGYEKLWTEGVMIGLQLPDLSQMSCFPPFIPLFLIIPRHMQGSPCSFLSVHFILYGVPLSLHSSHPTSLLWMSLSVTTATPPPANAPSCSHNPYFCLYLHGGGARAA